MKDAIILSIKISVVATMITLVVGIFFARIFTKYNFKFKTIIESFIIIPMVLPPSVVGYGLLVVLGKNGPVGEFVYKLFEQSLIFTPQAACIACIVVALPMMYQSCKTAFLEIDTTYEDVAKDLGATDSKVFWKIIIPLSKKGIIGGTILSFARAFGEFGATLMVAGNIPGKTQTVPLAIYFFVESGDIREANILIIITIIINFTTIFILNKLK